MRIYAKILDGFGLMAGLGYASAAAVTAIDVVLRNSGGDSIRGLVDVIEYGLFASTFLAAPWVLYKSAHVRVDFVVDALPKAGRAAAGLLTHLSGLGIALVILYYSARVTLQAREQGYLVLKSVVFPEWWALAVIPVASAMLAVEFARRLLAAIQPDGKPEL